MTRVSVMGAGAWGTAFSLVLADAGSEVVLWARRPEVAEGVNRTSRNPGYLSDVELPAAVRATSDPVEALDGAEVVVLAVPSQRLRESLRGWRLPASALVVSLAKGIELGTDQRMSQVIAEAGAVHPERIGIVTGPNLAREIAERQPAAAVVAAAAEATALRLQTVCHSPTFRPYTNGDVLGCELAGATKNVIALAVGMGSGLGYGANAMASVMTRGLAETARLGEAMGADPHTFAGLAGMGDLAATCMSPLSRNRTFGEHLGRGLGVEEATAVSQGVAEGVKSCESIADLARTHGVDMPIVTGVQRVVNGALTPPEALRLLLSRAPKPERT
ncbi:NAD(P)H-dependent glycerol-3-phosphate dehydrogenase [Auraticoccus monumenti]|uniref:Glycerol-3-phosphate dehydrogenase [NAD(P)+] n=1 Tax=Auraticoccus monumenti TaxID=675864 RepID=A0A1G7CNN3_9ACTN|nr:NAD(P)H-dependent glycerol-3-phosphate dehydrogenase [Auraticoccus monumenti]SDE40919.1 glycerol-3-phosphate dehydrogenase (NAD(P)+) [Auraticoccus monumenti]